jgi:hypothetical protein
MVLALAVITARTQFAVAVVTARNRRCAPARKECNKLDLTAAQYF